SVHFRGSAGGRTKGWAQTARLNAQAQLIFGKRLSLRRARPFSGFHSHVPQRLWDGGAPRIRCSLSRSLLGRFAEPCCPPSCRPTGSSILAYLSRFPCYASVDVATLLSEANISCG